MTKDELRIVFFGTPEFAVESLDTLVNNGFNVVAAVTMPDKAAGRGQKISQSDVKKYAVAHGIPVLQPEKLKNPEFLEDLRSFDAHLFIVIAFRMLPEAVWAMPPLGTFNLHAALLPRYRGAAPINRAVMNGDTETGVTTFFLDHNIDTGDIISRERIEIGPDETAGSVHDRLMTLGAALTLDTVRHIIAGDLHTTPQSELIGDEQPTPAPKIFKEDCLIDWNKTSAEIHNHVRGLSPYPAAWSKLSTGSSNDNFETTIKIIATKISADSSAPALASGELALSAKHAFAGTADGAIELVTVQPAGKRPMPAADWLRGLRPTQDGCKPLLK